MIKHVICFKTAFKKALLLRCFDCSNFLCANCVMAHQVSDLSQMQQICWTNPLVAYPQYPIDSKWFIKFSENFYQYAMHCLYFQFMHCFEGHHVSTLGEITSNSGGHHVQVKKKMKTMIKNIAKGTTDPRHWVIWLIQQH